MPDKISTWRITINGILQGVGFRPFVHALAHELDLKGCIANTSNGVVIEFNGSSAERDHFYSELLKMAPPLSHITDHELIPVQRKEFENFTIKPSKNETINNLKITPDLAVCDVCEKEIFDSSNRRYHYEFTTCTNCGPRYSILKQLPFDRPNTTMKEFAPCKACEDEYNDPGNPRHHSQTNSCNICGPQLSLYNCASQAYIDDKDPDVVKIVGDLLVKASIVAVKGIGGYILLADATNEEVLKKLRERKNRPGKPFALMYPDLDSVKDHYYVSNEESEALLSAASPIVLLRMKAKSKDKIQVEQVNTGLNRVGIMIPYAPLYALIMDEVKKPLVATSGNISKSPIIYTDEGAIENLSAIADYILMHNRKIICPQDDSVIQFTGEFLQKIILRRSRGLAPNYLDPDLKISTDKFTISMGADLKNTFGFLFSKNTLISQYLGDQSHFDTQEACRGALDIFIHMINRKPGHILIDKHPGYYSRTAGQQLADKYGASIEKVQHHISHFAAILGEHNLLDTEQKVMGVIWDGVGYGDDDQIWGGEFFEYKKKAFQRIKHLQYFPVIAMDKMSREPRISAFSLGSANQRMENLLKNKFSEEEWRIYSKKLKEEQNIKSSSMGRLFDAVASLIGICDITTYEGEAALYLQSLAEDYFRKEGYNKIQAYPAVDKKYNLDYRLLFNLVIDDLEKNTPIDKLSAKFHITLVEWIKSFAQANHFKHLAFSGGVFQNTVLVDLIIHHLGSKLNLYFHRQLSPNDENISFGQLIFSQISG